MTDGLRWGILGTGSIAHTVTRDFQANDIEVVAVGSRSQQSADEFAATFGLRHAHGSYEDLAQNDEVDVIYVATPHPFHAEGAELALNGGKHVLVEKPFTLNAAEARRVVDLAAERGLVVLEAMWTRWLPNMVRVREIVASGVIGDVRSVIADHTQATSPDPEGRMLNPHLGGGALLDLGIYPISFAWDMLGAPEKVSALASFTDTGVDRQVSIALEFEGGRHASVLAALDTPGANRATVIGTEGRIELDRVWYTASPITVFDRSNRFVERFVPEVVGDGKHLQARELERLAAAGSLSGDILSAEESVGIMGTLDEVRRQIGLTYPGEGPGTIVG
ncbi:putative dehydrogenase [Diaminobutyricimonas aerilata]|uniref:Putative dehydrogenase n=1 Tax=Diaminobutyricimonas aerilata TaxID=1162967 RepID=A0A2M9CGZ7_9MICO|nr:Gfo/Idh/MocA family oxidoreductase [Diaminobutyricimonas aerilata]PJJ71140.1 putative dehydrogenase [Diaminobutyricimonas aerilata]